MVKCDYCMKAGKKVKEVRVFPKHKVTASICPSCAKSVYPGINFKELPVYKKKR